MSATKGQENTKCGHYEPLLCKEQQQSANSQLVLLPDLTEATRKWCSQWLLMLTWLLTSVLALLIMAPMATSYQWSLVSDSAVIAAAMGIVGSVLHIRERDLAVNNILELGAQLKMASTCGIIACSLDAFIIAVNLVMLYNTGCLPFIQTCSAAAVHNWMFVLYFLHHGVVSYAVASRADSTMPHLELLSYDAATEAV